jgi:hypothetical protein
MWYVIVRTDLGSSRVDGPFGVRKSARDHAITQLGEPRVIHCEVVRAESRVFTRTEVIETDAAVPFEEG